MLLGNGIAVEARSEDGVVAGVDVVETVGKSKSSLAGVSTATFAAVGVITPKEI